MVFKPIQQLQVTRKLSTGEEIVVGVLAQNARDVFFQYDVDYIANYHNLSPFNLKANSELQVSPKKPHGGLHGIFADSLPDGWGRLLQDRVFRQQGIPIHEITTMDRLAFVGDRGMGALSYLPTSDYTPCDEYEVSLASLGLEAQAVFDGQTDEVFLQLVAAGSSGGARPKAQLYFAKGDFAHCRTYEKAGDEAWLVKFTSKNLPLGHDEGLCESIYLTLAKMADLDPPEWRLIDAPAQSGAKAWIALKRFDWVNNGIHRPSGRLVMHSACGLLDADFREPSLDYETLIKVNRILCKSVYAGQLQFRRAIFNLFAANQDDHSKNWSFIQIDDGQWSPAPFYDVTYNPNAMNEHTTSFLGFGKKPPREKIQQLAEDAGFANWEQARICIQEIVDVLSHFPKLAQEISVSKTIQKDIEQTLTERRHSNAALFER